MSLVAQGRDELGGGVNRNYKRRNFFQILLDDIALFTRLENVQKAGLTCTSAMYYKILVDDFADEMRRKNNNLLKIGTLGKSEEWEKKVWKRIFYQGLDTKIQAFNFKIVHGALPTLEVMSKYSLRFHNSWCPYCRFILGCCEVENEEHIFLTCHIAKAVWHVVNDKLKNNGMEVIKLTTQNIFYKADMRMPHAFFVSEVMWALWRNRCTNLYEDETNGKVVVLKYLKSRLILNSKIDKKLLAVKAYRNRWLGVNEVISLY